jgi:hypothetical protein
MIEIREVLTAQAETVTPHPDLGDVHRRARVRRRRRIR